VSQRILFFFLGYFELQQRRWVDREEEEEEKEEDLRKILRICVCLWWILEDWVREFLVEFSVMTITQQGGSVGRSVMVSSSGNNNNSSSSNGGKKKKSGQSCNSSSPLLLSQQEEGMVAAVNGVEVILGSGDGGGGGGSSTGSSIDGLSSPGKTFCNLVISIVGAGVLGLPYAFKASGWLEASLILCALSFTMYYCMMLLVRSRRRMETDWGVGSVSTYSNLGFHAFGTAGQAAVDAMVLLSQGGFCIAYLIFIGENLASVFTRQDSLSTPAADLLPNSQQMGAAAAASDLMGSMWKLQWKTKEIYIWIVFPLQVSTPVLPPRFSHFFHLRFQYQKFFVLSLCLQLGFHNF
jgi:proton-coupled amino acid transporter